MSTANIDKKNTTTLRSIGKTNAFAKKRILSALSQFRVGHLIIEDGSEIYTFGEAERDADIIARLSVHNASLYKKMLFEATIGAAESYMDGHWSTDDLVKVVQIMVLNLNIVNDMDGSKPWFRKLIGNIYQAITVNSKQGAKKNIAAHYDLGNDFFSLFLDKTMMYSSAIFPDDAATLHHASTHKLNTICQKLGLTKDDHLLEIGTGWGGLAIHAAMIYECKVTTTTISKQQYDYTKQKIASLGLQDKITLLLKDYREVEGCYDKLASVEMIEAVGHQYYNAYFQQCSRLLKPSGLMLIQAITIIDQRYKFARDSVDFIKRYIFPGGCLPSNQVIADCVATKTDMQIVALEDITTHYANTLAHWRQAFTDNIAKIKSMGFDDSFCRMWEFYFCYCEGSFRERAISTSQIVMAKPRYRD